VRSKAAPLPRPAAQLDPPCPAPTGGCSGAETSSRSTKLIWAGIRYIATATSQLLRWKSLAHPRQALADFLDELSMVGQNG
jgi:hypothetical protein